MTETPRLHLFEGYGIEIEYMIVGAGDLNVRPVADELLKLVGGDYEMEVERGDLAWSNELALHVIELKTNGPAATLAGLGQAFQAHVRTIEEMLADMEARLLPTAMHPWMNPQKDLKLWPHENDIIYATFNRIFDCRGHGWANLQSMHVNLPFANDREFGALHAAIRMVLPLLPALAASSPYADGSATGFADTRLDYYRRNAARVPSIAGQVVPERVYTRKEYETDLLGRIYRDLRPLDPEGVIRHEWVNARGAIARFDRSAIEIRTIDVQETPAADIAVAAAVCAAVRGLTEQHWCSEKAQRVFPTRQLAHYHAQAERDGDRTVISEREYLDCFGFPESGAAKLSDVWQHLNETLLARDPNYGEWLPWLTTIRERGCLARRIVEASGPMPDRGTLTAVYERLADCLRNGQSFRP